MLQSLKRGFWFAIGALTAVTVTAAVVLGLTALAIALFADRG